MLIKILYIYYLNFQTKTGTKVAIKNEQNNNDWEIKS